MTESVLMVDTAPGTPLEVALDFLRTEGWEPYEGPTPSPAKVGSPGRFVNRCDRCLQYRQAARKDLSRTQRVWLCSECSGPNPPEVVIEKADSIHDLIKQQRKKAKEERKREREEAKARKRALPRVRRNRNKAGEQTDALGESAEGAVIRVQGDASPLHGSGALPDAHGLARTAEEISESVLNQGGSSRRSSGDGGLR